ncbi:MAG TPA: FG-GAP-like repeat-containing protein, partial [Verrucomicrobiae bacterium]|nr:FG-GAP-like repeat-containing protein [Verrucomicrobiae bacterium]
MIHWAGALSVLFATIPLAARGVDWQSGEHYRFAPLPPPSTGQPGFTLLPAATTGVTAANILSEDRAMRNQNLMNGAGVAAGDFDGDGWVDFFLCSMDGNSVLYRNLGGWKFQDVTASSGISTTNRIPTGAAFADINGDGRLDLIVTSSGGPNSVFLNDGEGHFHEMVLPPGEVARAGSESIALVDVDGDGDLDLYVANYGEISILRGGINPGTAIVNGKEQVVGRYKNRIKIRADGTFSESGEPHVLYLNDGKGNFTPAPWNSEMFLDEEGKPMPAPWDMGLSVMFGDLNQDGHPDLYVCNDFQTEDRVWINDGKGHFRLIDKLALRNTSNFSMSVDFGDINGDGLPDLFVVDMLSPSHFHRMTQMDPGERPPWHPGVMDDRPQIRRNTLFLNRGDGTFAEIANLAGVAATDWTWCTAFLDVDLDGYPDLLVTNGHMFDVQDLDVIESQRARGKATGVEGRRRLLEFPPLNTPHVAFRNRGDLTFEDASARWGFDTRHVSQGIALADLDNDGDLDVIVNSLNAPPLLYRNNSAAPRLAIRLAGNPPNTRGIGAKIRVTARGLPVQTQEMIAGGRYLSGDDAERVFACGAVTQLAVEVTWRTGKRSIITDAKPNSVYEINESGAQAATVPPPPKPAPVFTEVSDALHHTHYEELFDDFARQPLLPRLYSQLGPGIACVDLNGDGHDDLVIGAGRNGNVAVYLGDGHGGFKALESPALKTPVIDDTAGMAGWVAKPGQRSVLIGLADYESGVSNGPSALQLSLDAQGAVALQPLNAIHLPPGTSPGPLAVADFDADGDLDLFIGGRVAPGRYPENPVSQVYKNEGGNLVLDGANTSVLQGAGMVSGAVWSDLDGDGFPELILACEWAPVRVYHNDKGKLREATREWGLAGQ